MSKASDSVAFTKRNLLRLSRTPEVMVFSTIQPIMFVILFNAVFGGSIDASGFGNYIDFLVPGIMVQTAMFGSTNTGVGVAEDLEKGAIDRFRSLPVWRPAILFGRTFADSMRAFVVMVVVVLTGVVFGFRPTGGVVNIAAAIVLATAFTFCIQWAFVYLALMIRSLEGVQAASFAPTFPLVFASSTFAPVENMPGWLKGFAQYQPVTTTTDSLRGLFLGPEILEASGGSLQQSILLTIMWSIVIFAVFATLSTVRFRKN